MAKYTRKKRYAMNKMVRRILLEIALHNKGETQESVVCILTDFLGNTLIPRSEDLH